MWAARAGLCAVSFFIRLLIVSRTPLTVAHPVVIGLSLVGMAPIVR